MRLHKLINVVEHSETLAKTAVATSLSSTVLANLGVVNEVLTTIATIVAIVSGLFAARFYYNKSKYYCLKLKEAEDDERPS